MARARQGLGVVITARARERQGLGSRIRARAKTRSKRTKNAWADQFLS